MSSLSPHPPARRGEQGSVIIALLMVVIVSTALVTMITGALGASAVSSSMTADNQHLQDATAGNQAAVAEIRAATNAGGYVVPGNLPCNALTGQTNGTGSGTWGSTIVYYVQTSSGSSVPEQCTPGLGPAVNSAAGTLTKAVVTTCAPAGACPAGASSPGSGLWRRVVSTYVFEANNANIPGGQIFTSDGNSCMVAVITDGQNPANGMTLQAMPKANCASGSAYYSLEQFQYTTQFTIEITIAGTNYCVQDPEDAGGTVPTDPVVNFALCSTGYVDQWGINDVSGIEGVTTDGMGNENYWCLDSPYENTTPSIVTTRSCGYAAGNQTWYLSPTTGAGGAAPPTAGAGGAAPTAANLFGSTNQMVNFDEFGQCLDVTSQNVNAQFLIDYTCKQFPNVARYPIWNQRWCFAPTSAAGASPPTGVLYTPYVGGAAAPCGSASSPPANAYCLTSTKTPYGTGANGGAYVTVTSCLPFGTAPASGSPELWTPYGGVTAAVHSYTWVDQAGLCLETNPANKWNGYSTIATDVCNSSLQQKWNAPPTIADPQVSNIHEGTGAGAYTGP